MEFFFWRWYESNHAPCTLPANNQKIWFHYPIFSSFLFFAFFFHLFLLFFMKLFHHELSPAFPTFLIFLWAPVHYRNYIIIIIIIRWCIEYRGEKCTLNIQKKSFIGYYQVNEKKRARFLIKFRKKILICFFLSNLFRVV